MKSALVRRLSVVAVLVGLVASSMPADAATKRTTKRTTKRAVRTTTRPTTIASTIATTAAPTIATTAATVPTTTTAAPTTTAAAPIAFERSVYAVTVAPGGAVTVPLWINNIPTGLRDSLTLRTRGEGAETRLRFDPNPARNYTVLTVQNVSGSGQLPLITIEAVPTAEPTRVIASTVISVFVSGSGVAGTVPVSNVPGPDGASFAVYVASGNATRGGDAISVQIGITRTGSFTGPVDFSLASALPAGMIVSFNEKSVAGSQNFVFVRAAASTPVGTYDLVIDAVTVIRRTPLTIRVVVV